MSSQEVLGYKIGFEVEGFIELKKAPDKKFESNQMFANLVVSTFNNSLSQGQRQLALNWGEHPGHKLNDETHKDKWIVTEDVTLGNLKTEIGWGLEFISVVYRFEKNSKWRHEVIDFWKRLLEIGRLSTTNVCATHVHISPHNEGNSWSLDQLKGVAQAVVYFEQAFEVIVAPSRRGNSHVYRNKANNRFLQNLDFKDCCKSIQGCSDVDQLVLLIQPRPFEPEDGCEDNPRKAFAWNFMNTKKNEIGTIEFRCAPGVLSGKHCLVWVEVAVSFVQAAVQYGTEDILNECNSDVEGLLKFIKKASVEDMNKRELLNVVFDGCEGALEPISEPEEPEDEGEDLDKEMRDRFDERIEALSESVFT